MQIITNPQYDDRLKQLAKEKGFVDGGRPNVTAYFNAVASGEIPQGERQYLDDAPWFSAVRERIEKKQPFVIHYGDAEGTLRSFKATYAELIWREKRLYLEIYDPEEGQDYQKSALPELQHNRCFRIDRIQRDAGILDLEMPWRQEGLETIEAVFDLFGGLAYSYSAKPDDKSELIDKGHRRVWRQINSDFWFLRTISAYGDRCEVVSPAALRNKAIDSLYKLAEKYGLRFSKET